MEFQNIKDSTNIEYPLPLEKGTGNGYFWQRVPTLPILFLLGWKQVIVVSKVLLMKGRLKVKEALGKSTGDQVITADYMITTPPCTIPLRSTCTRTS